MKILISLTVKYGFPVQTLYSFLNSADHDVWNNYLKYFSHEIAVSGQEGKVFWLIHGHENIEQLKSVLKDLPLLKEEFLEIQLHELSEFKDLSCLFNFVTK